MKIVRMAVGGEVVCALLAKEPDQLFDPSHLHPNIPVADDVTVLVAIDLIFPRRNNGDGGAQPALFVNVLIPTGYRITSLPADEHGCPPDLR